MKGTLEVCSKTFCQRCGFSCKRIGPIQKINGVEGGLGSIGVNNFLPDLNDVVFSVELGFNPDVVLCGEFSTQQKGQETQRGC